MAITATIRTGTATVDVDITGKTAGENIIVTRSDANGYTSIVFDALSSTSYMVTDWSAALRGTITYYVETSDSNGTVTSSETTSVAFPDGMLPVISNAFGHGAVTARTVLDFNLARTSQNVSHAVPERRLPVVVLRDPTVFSGTFSLICATLDEARSIEAFLSTSHRTLMLRDQEHGIDTRFIWEDTQIAPAAAGGSYWRVTVRFTEYTRYLTTETGPTFQDLVDDGASFHQVALNDTFYTLAAGRN